MIVLFLLGAMAFKGRPLFLQTRIGQNEKPFKLWKFRSMRSEKGGSQMSEKDRMNSYGRLLRATSLDELPQLWNVLKGDMSLVGPRPLIEEYLPLYTERQRKRHEVRPGITGWAQINGRNEQSWKSKFEKDIWYVENMSLVIDIQILWKTIPRVLRAKGIRHPESDTAPFFNGSN